MIGSGARWIGQRDQWRRGPAGRPPARSPASAGCGTRCVGSGGTCGNEDEIGRAIPEHVIRQKMRRRMADMPDDERAELEEAATVLRRVRAGDNRKLLPLTVIQSENK